MPETGYLSTLGRTADATLTRDKLIEMAFQNIGVLPEGAAMSAEMLQAGIDRLDLIVREVDEVGAWRWTVQEPVHIPLRANVGIYDANGGLPTNCSEILSAVYRGHDGRDSAPLKILSAEGYEEISDKLQTGEPRAVHLTTGNALATRRLYVWPFPSSISTRSEVVGIDGLRYQCLYPHTSSTSTAPGSGSNWRMVWQLGGLGVTAWATSTAYTAAEALRLVVRRPIFDFDSADNTPDIPPQLQRALLFRLCDDLQDPYPSPDNSNRMAEKYKGAYSDVVASLRKKTNDIHNKVRYF
jgi:hypothetical protein